MKSLILPLLLLLTSCLPEESKPTSSSLYVAAGDILITSTLVDVVHQFDKDGNYIRQLWRTNLASEVVGGLGWAHSTNEILISINGTPDRVVAVSVIDGRERVLAVDANLNGTPAGVTQLTDSRDIIVTEGATIERFSEAGLRETFAVWPAALPNVQAIQALDDGTWVTASTSTAVRLYNDSTTSVAPIATATAPVGTTGAYGVVQLRNGKFLTSWEGGAADYLSVYNADLTFDRHIIGIDQALLINPRGVAEKKNGNFLVADTTRDYVIEVTPAGDFVKFIGQGILDGAYAVFVVPDFSP